jgi:glc operon protein GlcG
MNRLTLIGACAAGLFAAAAANAQAPAALSYGPNITLEQAKQVVAAAEAEATKRKLQATIAILDTGGNLIYFQRATNGAGNAEAFAMKKALSAVRNRRPSNYDAARLAAGINSVQYVPDAFPFPGGFPIVIDGKIAGAIGETGGADDDVARAGAAAFH